MTAFKNARRRHLTLAAAAVLVICVHLVLSDQQPAAAEAGELDAAPTVTPNNATALRLQNYPVQHGTRDLFAMPGDAAAPTN